MLTGNDVKKLIESQSFNTIKWYIRNLIDMYRDNWGYIIKANMESIFLKSTIESMKPLYTKEFNLLKNVVNTISMIYRENAQREAVIGKSVIDEEYARLMSSSNIDTVMREANRYTNLCNQVLVRPIVNKRTGVLSYELLNFDNARIIIDPDEWDRIVGVEYYTGLVLPNYDSNNTYVTGSTTINDRIEHVFPFESYRTRVLWTIEDDGSGRETTVYRKFKYISKRYNGTPKEELVEEIRNVYFDKNGNAILPFVLLTRQEPIDTLLDFSSGCDLFDATITCAIDLIQYNNIKKVQSFKQLYITDVEVDKLPKEIKTDPNAIIAVPPNGAGKQTVIGTLDLQSDFDKIYDAMERRARYIKAQYNINPNDNSGNATPSSGYAKLMENIKLVEAREADIPRYRRFEEELYKKTVVVWNTDRIRGDALNDNAEFRITFGDVDYPSDPQSEITTQQSEIDYGIISPIDVIMKRNHNMTREEALQKYQENISDRKLSNGSGQQIQNEPLVNPSVEQ